MQTLVLRTFIMIFVALGLAAALSWNTGVQLRVQPQGTSAEFEARIEQARKERLQQQNVVIDPAQPAGETQRTPEEAPAAPDNAVESTVGGEPAGEAPGTSGEDNYVTVERAHELFELEFVGPSQVIFIDARARAEFEKGHIRGAMSLPAGEFGPRTPQKAQDYLPGSIVVIYCQGADCHDSHDVAIRLQQAKLPIERILIFKAGFPAWVEAGHPVSTGPDVVWQ